MMKKIPVTDFAMMSPWWFISVTFLANRMSHFISQTKVLQLSYTYQRSTMAAYRSHYHLYLPVANTFYSSR